MENDFAGEADLLELGEDARGDGPLRVGLAAACGGGEGGGAARVGGAVPATRGSDVSSRGRPTGGGGIGRGVSAGGGELSWKRPSEWKFAVRVIRSIAVVPRSNPAESSANDVGR